MPAFPSYVEIFLDGFSENPSPAVLRTETEDGFAKQAVRYSRVLVKRPATAMIKTSANLAAFKAWVKTDITSGAAWFDWFDPVIGQTVQARIEGGKVAYKPIGSLGLWQASFTLETWE